MTLRVGVLVSGGGTNLQALLDACAAPGFPAEIVIVGCNRAGAAAIGRAEAAGVPVCLADRAAAPGRAVRQTMLLQAFQTERVDLVVLAGFDEILVPEFVAAYSGRMLNTHPSLLPAFGGTMHAVEQALAHGVKIAGCTVHLVTNDLDSGPILLQQCVEVRDEDDVASLHARIREQEHRLLPVAVRAFAEGRLKIEGRRARVIRS
ncbi:MAG TPA: phosphoribosylglycinamide formyltransferase [Chloroflexota bacterium]|nr:phosphoribosylglycinamide formyltransferase [Chloroflexota bacterium]